MPTSDDIIEHAAEFLRRISPEGREARRRQRARRQAAFRRLARRLVVATAAILAAAIVIGAWTPLGLFGFLAMIVAMMMAWAAIILWSAPAEPTPQRMATTDLAALPARTGEWLDRERAALPAPAQRQVDQLALSLQALQPQLAGLDPKLPEAIEARRLIADELPELVRGWQRVPQSLRRQPMDGGASPDRQLADGLATIEAEVRRMNARLAAGDLKALATQNRYLEIKYKGDGSGDGIA